MIKRYEDPGIAEACSNKAKAERWQNVEAAVIEAKCQLLRIPEDVHKKILQTWTKNPVDQNKWAELEKLSDHDLAAFVSERKSYLPNELAVYVHADNMTSYDTEEPAFAQMLLDCLTEVFEQLEHLDAVLVELANKHRYTVMNGRTHGQEAEMQSFGKRCLTWLKPIRQAKESLEWARDKRLLYTKLSGAIGNYTGIDPELEMMALRNLGLQPYVGATQIIPRTHYIPLASGLNELMGAIANIAIDIRLGARSGRPIYREPFRKTQVGSSAMPHKKNPIKTENNAGMKIMSSGFLAMLDQIMVTWEERAIEQSCVERVAWPDLFHIVMHSLKTLTRVLGELQVYPDNMIQEIHESRGCYAASLAKGVLAELLMSQGLSSEDTYRIVQLAAFNVFEPSAVRMNVRKSIASSFAEAKGRLTRIQKLKPEKVISIQQHIMSANLRVSPELQASAQQVQKWNEALRKLFKSAEAQSQWNEIFEPKYLLRNEYHIFGSILGE